MIPLRWEEVVALDLGELDGEPSDGIVARIHADSREARPGDLFVALNTGVRFVSAARAAGAATLVPRDQHAALATLARLVRARSRARVVAVVGSMGKTSTKDALAALCGAVTETVAAHASQNNEIGLPLTVLRLEPTTRVLVVEMGMRGHGQIAELCAVAQPTVVVVTGIGPEHLELVGSVEHVARANAEALVALPPGGVAVVPSDARTLLAPYLTRDDLVVRWFDRARCERVGPGTRAGTTCWRCTVATHDAASECETVELDLPFDQRHQVENVLAALTAYAALGLPLERAQEGAAAIRLSPWRGELTRLPGGGVVVNDAYNANPTSMRAALLDLTERAAGRRRVAVIGEMAELGAESARYHGEVAALIDELGIEVVICVGEGAHAYGAAGTETHWVASPAAFAEVAHVLRPSDAILVKASRAVGLEGIPAAIEKVAETWSAS